MLDHQSETASLLNKRAASSPPKRRAFALTLIVALISATALVNLVPASGGAGNLRATRLQGGAASAQDDDAPQSKSFQDRVAAVFQSILDTEAKAWDCSISVAVKTESETAALAAGVIDKSTGATASPSDVYPWGLVTMMLTGASVMRLADEGKFDIDDAAAPIVDAYIQNIAQQEGDAWNFTWTSLEELFQNASVNDITIRELLAMQAPLPDFNNDGLRDYQTSDEHGYPDVWALLDSIEGYPALPLKYSWTNYLFLGMIVAHYTDGLAPEETDQAYYLPDHLKEQLHFGNKGQAASEWTDVKLYDRTSSSQARKWREVRNQEWSGLPGNLLGWTASNLLASAPAVADMVYSIYGEQSVTNKVAEMTSDFHKDPWNQCYGLATMNLGGGCGLEQDDMIGLPEDGSIPAYGLTSSSYGAQSIAYYIPFTKTSISIVTNLEIYSEPHTKYIACLANNVAANVLLPQDDPIWPAAADIRKKCQDVATKFPSDVYRDANLRETLSAEEIETHYSSNEFGDPAMASSFQDKFAAVFEDVLKFEAKAWDCAFSIAVKTKNGTAALAAGVVDHETGATAKSSDVWAWGSVTKPITGASVLHLADLGKLALDDPAAPIIDAYIQNIARQQGDAWNYTWTSLEELFQNASVNDVTIREMLAMQAPIPDLDTIELQDAVLDGAMYNVWDLLDADWVKNRYPAKRAYSSTTFLLLGMVVAHFADGLPPEATDQAYYLPDYVRKQLHFGNNGQTVSEWSDVKFYDLTSDPDAPGELIDWSDKPGIFFGWAASDLAASVPAVADLYWEIYGPPQSVTKQVDDMVKFHKDSAVGTYGLATEENSPAPFPSYGHGGITYGAESAATYYEIPEVVIVVASNIEAPQYRAPQKDYVKCLAEFAVWNILDFWPPSLPDSEELNSRDAIRYICQELHVGANVHRDQYRQLNLRKASD